MKRKILLVLGLLIIAIQFVPISKNDASEISDDDFILSEIPPMEIAVLLKNSCYDCHSNRTRYPWYSSVAPVSWWIKYHIVEGKDELNFSEWNSYSVKKKKHKLEEIIEELEEEHMPLDSYLITHGDARVDAVEFIQLKKWIETIK